jgi:hypothetical protein
MMNLKLEDGESLKFHIEMLEDEKQMLESDIAQLRKLSQESDSKL